MPNPYLLLGALIGAVMLFLGGVGLGMKYEKGQAAREEVLIAKAGEAAALASAVEIGKIQITQTTIRQKAQETIREVPVYRDCVHSPDVLRLLNEAATNGAFESPDRGKLPVADAPGG